MRRIADGRIATEDLDETVLDCVRDGCDRVPKISEKVLERTGQQVEKWRIKASLQFLRLSGMIEHDHQLHTWSLKAGRPRE